VKVWLAGMNGKLYAANFNNQNLSENAANYVGLYQALKLFFN